MTSALKAILACAFVFLSVANGEISVAQAQDGKDNAVFRIGTFNRSSIEFAPGDPKQAVNFVVGQSDPSKDWYATQLAELGSAVGSKVSAVGTAPRTITFSIESLTGSYKLHLSLLIESASVPALQVSVNGKHGLFYLHPQLDYSNGDQGDSFYPAYSHADVEFAIPTRNLQQGKNTITLQAIEEADEKVPDASLTYDAIELDRESAGTDTGPSSAQIMPTVFFQRQDGELREIVDAFIRYGERIKPGAAAELTIAGKKYNKTLHGDQDFGEEKLEFFVSEFSAKTDAQLTWDINGHREHDEQLIDPKKKWTVFLVPHIHVDVGYSDYQAKVAAIQSRSIDEAMDMTAQHPEFRFSLDGEWDLEQFLKTRTAAQQQRAITAIEKEQLYVPAQYANLLTGFPTAETLIRSLYPSANFSRIHRTPFNYANITDVPSYSWSYASILAAAGLHDLAGGSNNYRAPVLLQGRLNEASPMWWEGTDGKKVLLWYSRIYQQMQMLFGLPPLLPAGHDTFPLFLQMYEHPGYHADATMLYGTQVENTDLFPQQAELAGKWNSLYAYPHLQYSGFKDALENIRAQFGDAIPTIRGDGGPYWEDGIASDAYYAGMERWNEGRAPTAEKLATLSSLVNPLLIPDKEALARMWTNIVLMDEHTWDSYNSTTDSTSMEATQQLAIKDQYAVNAAALADFVTKNNMASIVNAIPAGIGNLIVFNSLNWKRNGSVAVDIGKDQEIVDMATGQAIPFEVVNSGDNFRHVRFEALDVPAVGYKVFEVRLEHQASATAEEKQTKTIESPYYKVELDAATGAVRSIYDKQLQRELVNQQSPYRFGQYLYVSGGDKAPNSILQYSHVYPKADLVIHPAQDGSVVSVRHTSGGWIARMQSQATNTPSIAAEIRLSDTEKKIDFVEDVDKKSVLNREAVYFAFPFAMDQPEFHYEIQNGVVDPVNDMYPGAGHEWFSVQHWVSVQQDGVSGTVMPLDASLVTLGDINRGGWPEQFGKRAATVFSYAMNNYWDTNYRAAQGGHFQFHYVVTSAPSTDAPSLSRMGWEEITPLEEDTVTTQDKAMAPSPQNAQDVSQSHAEGTMKRADVALDAKLGSFLDVSDPNILLETWKAAEDGNGTILRFLDLGGTERTVIVQVPLIALKQAMQTDAVERDQTPLTLSGDHGFKFTIQHNEIVTVRIVGSSKSPAPK
jgi:alpha-mannosidase